MWTESTERFFVLVNFLSENLKRERGREENKHEKSHGRKIVAAKISIVNKRNFVVGEKIVFPNEWRHGFGNRHEKSLTHFKYLGRKQHWSFFAFVCLVLIMGIRKIDHVVMHVIERLNVCVFIFRLFSSCKVFFAFACSAVVSCKCQKVAKLMIGSRLAGHFTWSFDYCLEFCRYFVEI